MRMFTHKGDRVQTINDSKLHAIKIVELETGTFHTHDLFRNYQTDSRLTTTTSTTTCDSMKIADRSLNALEEGIVSIPV